VLPLSLDNLKLSGMYEKSSLVKVFLYLYRKNENLLDPKNNKTQQVKTYWACCQG
jgi:hypothetical protein